MDNELQFHLVTVQNLITSWLYQLHFYIYNEICGLSQQTFPFKYFIEHGSSIPGSRF
jgi:hypothetical protein